MIEILDKHLGVRFLTSTVTVGTVSTCPWGTETTSFSFLPSNYTFTPILEYRDVLAYDVVHADPSFAVNQRLNGGPTIPVGEGSGPIYATPPGFVHTSYALVNKTALFESHNEWFWPRDDISVYGQLCWSNASLVEYVITQVRSFLRKSCFAFLSYKTLYFIHTLNPQVRNPKPLSCLCHRTTTSTTATIRTSGK